MFILLKGQSSRNETRWSAYASPQLDPRLRAQKTVSVGELALISVPDESELQACFKVLWSCLQYGLHRAFSLPECRRLLVYWQGALQDLLKQLWLR